jgi:hypothetical protein
MTNVSNQIIPTPEDQPVASNAINREQWRKNLKMGDVAFVYSQHSCGPIAVLEWVLSEGRLGNSTEHVRAVYNREIRYFHRAYLYPTMPEGMPIDWITK